MATYLYRDGDTLTIRKYTILGLPQPQWLLHSTSRATYWLNRTGITKAKTLDIPLPSRRPVKSPIT